MHATEYILKPSWVLRIKSSDLSFIQSQLIFMFYRRLKLGFMISEFFLFKTITCKIILILSQKVASFKL